MKMRSSLSALDAWVSGIETVLLLVICLGLALSGVFAVAMRNLANQGFSDLPLLERSAVIWIAVLGASLATREGSHLGIDLLPRIAKGRWRRVLLRINAGIGTAVSVIFFLAALSFLKLDFESGAELAFGIKAWHVQVILPIGLLVSAARYLAQVFIVNDAADASGDPLAGERGERS